MSAARCLRLIVAIVLSLVAADRASAQFIDLGPAAFGGAYDQPFVQITFYDGTQELGPTSFRKTFLLDTGANGILAVGGAASELHQSGNFAEGSFLELGVGGFIEYWVSAPYTAEISGSNAIELQEVRILSDPSTNFGDFVPFEGIVGMPAMVGRVTSLDLQVGGGFGDTGDIDLTDLDALIDLLASGLSGIEVSFSPDLPANQSAGRRHGVATRPLYFDPEGGEGPPPTYAPLTVVTAEHYTNCGSVRGDGYIIDTGAQLSFISLEKARGLGLDPENPFTTVTIAGVGGTRTVPVFLLEELRIPTVDGVDLVWTGVEVVGLDIHPTIDGVIGADLLTAGMLQVDFTTTNLDEMIKVGEGPIEKVHFDFRDLDRPDQSGSGVMYLDLDENFDVTVVPGDANRDGRVDGGDLSLLVGNWNMQLPLQTPEGEIFYGHDMADFNFDCQVDITDLTILAENWNYGVATPAPPLNIQSVLATVPEPAVPVGLCLLLALPLLRRRR